jgi:isoleucyl-tRNA synthetase
MDYKPTLCLPKTDFAMKADLPKREPDLQARWESLGLYARVRAARKGAPSFVFHDGPPYANGDVHIGTVLNKVLKDFVVRSRSMMGFDVPFVPGWDCHGLPIEHRVMKEEGPKARDLSPAEIRRKCREYAEHYLDLQRGQFRRLGCLGDWDHPYTTMSREYEAGVLSVFEGMVEKGFVTRDKRSTAWCPNCATALAEAELEYHDRESPSVYVRMRVTNPSPALKAVSRGGEHFVIWTTTPWTLPANLAIAVHPDLDYTLFAADMEGLPQRHFIVATRLVDSVVRACGLRNPVAYATVKGRDLVGTTYRHPLADVEKGFPRTGGPPLESQPVVIADYVSAEDGTGCVHTAPGHGADDFRTGKANGLPPFSPLDDHGRYTDEVGSKLVGKKANGDANDAVLGLLERHLVARGKISHSYAHCWRCKGPILFRATDQWFIQVDHQDLRARALKEVESAVTWIPEWGRRRIGGMVQSRPDWCISRQRHWGIPIPCFRCAECTHSWTDVKVVARARELIATKGADAWFSDAPPTITSGFRCPKCNADSLQLGKDIFDVWFESGSSWRSVVQAHPDHRFPSDAVLEGTDQHRGWFQSSLLTAVAAEGKAPWRTVVTHGFITDAGGEKVSKSKGGLLNADELAKQFGADIARLWVASIEYREDVPVSREILQKTGEPYRRIRNTFRWILGNLEGFDPARDSVAEGDLLEADRWVLARLDEVVAEATAAFEAYEFSRGVRAVHDFCDRDLSAFWFDGNKDRFYCAAARGPERRSGQTAAFRVADALCRLLAPVLVHTMDEVWRALPGRREESVHLAPWPAPRPGRDDGELLRRWEVLRNVRAAAAVACEALRAAKTIGGNPEARLRIRPADAAVEGVLRSFGPAALADLLMVSEAEVLPAGGPASVEAEPSPHGKCARCWNLRPTVGKDARFADLCARCAGVVGAP